MSPEKPVDTRSLEVFSKALQPEKPEDHVEDKLRYVHQRAHHF